MITLTREKDESLDDIEDFTDLAVGGIWIVFRYVLADFVDISIGSGWSDNRS